MGITSQEEIKDFLYLFFGIFTMFNARVVEIIYLLVGFKTFSGN